MTTTPPETRPPTPADAGAEAEEAAAGRRPVRLIRTGRPIARRAIVGRPVGRSPSLLQSFNYAFEGVIHVLRTQRNMRLHFAAATVVLVFAFSFDVSKFELIALLLAIAFVLIAEMVNTAVEATIDVATTSFDPLAKLAKDIAAGAVLIASTVALLVGYLVFSDRIGDPTFRLVNRVREVPIDLTAIALVVTIIAVVAVKALTGRGTPLRGGLPSGHAALAFAGWMAITFVTANYQHRLLVSSLTFLMALLVAQTRVESGIHSTLEVALGGALGAVVTLFLFQVLG
jgi:diacylglycerol kinase (ATP)